MSLDIDNTDKFVPELISILQSSRIFADLDYAVCESLLATLERVNLPQGQTLFEQGEEADSLYILIDGQLVALLSTDEGKIKLVGTVEKGETVGEMGAFSTQPRTLTIRAVVDSQLLKFTNAQFKLFCKDQPNFISKIIDLIIERSQNTLKLISEKKPIQHIAVVPANNHVPMRDFIEQLRRNFPEDPAYCFIDKLPRGLTLAHFMAQAEMNEQTVVFILEEERYAELQMKINTIGSVIVVADGDAEPEFSEFALQMLSRQQTHFAKHYELVLLHGDQIAMPSGTKKWLDQVNVTLHHHIRITSNADYQRLLRFMFGKAVGLVLGGGGHKGWAIIGALRAILENNIPIDAIGGTSVGSIIAACYAIHMNYEDTYSAYRTCAHAAYKPFALKNLTWPLISLVSSKLPTEALWKVLGSVRIEDLWIPYFAVSCNLNQGKEVTHTSGLLWEAVRASAALPGIAPPMVINGELYYDGGLLNNLPVDHMRQLVGPDGATIGVTLAGMRRSEKLYNFPPVIPFWVGVLKRLRLGYKEYKFPPFFHTFMRALLVGSSSKEKENQLLADVIISPDLRHYHVLKLDLRAVKAMVECGYVEAQTKVKSMKVYLRDTEECGV